MRFQNLPRSTHPDFDLRPIREDDLPTLFSHLRDPTVVEAMGEGPKLKGNWRLIAECVAVAAPTAVLVAEALH